MAAGVVAMMEWVVGVWSQCEVGVCKCGAAAMVQAPPIVSEERET